MSFLKFYRFIRKDSVHLLLVVLETLDLCCYFETYCIEIQKTSEFSSDLSVDSLGLSTCRSYHL